MTCYHDNGSYAANSENARYPLCAHNLHYIEECSTSIVDVRYMTLNVMYVL